MILKSKKKKKACFQTYISHAEEEVALFTGCFRKQAGREDI